MIHKHVIIIGDCNSQFNPKTFLQRFHVESQILKF